MSITLRLPTPHEAQKIFVYWSEENPKAQCLIAPAGTKTGKSFGSALWLAKEALVNDGLFCIWIAPTYLKAKIGYRYLKAMLPEHPTIDCLDGKLEIRFANRSFIKFLHGKDAETTVEGEGVDRFVIDESGKLGRQVWYSLFTTITQTRGLGIVTGTPRGFTWYYDEFRKAKNGDPFYVWAQLRTEQSPYVQPDALIQARRLLPKSLYDQYYNAMFVSDSSVFGDIGQMFDESLAVNPGCKFWLHPNPAARALDTVTGWDIAKLRDYSVFATVNVEGKLVGYARFRRVPYDVQVDRLKHYLHTYFQGDRMLRYDATGVGQAIGELISMKDIDASVTAVTFTNKSKQDMVGRTSVAIENKWFSCPRIEQIEHEFGSYEVSATKSGLFSYSAPDGEHDDVVSACLLAITGAYQCSVAEEAEKMIESLVNGNMGKDLEDDITAYSDAATEDEDDFFSEEGGDDESFDFALD